MLKWFNSFFGGISEFFHSFNPPTLFKVVQWGNGVKQRAPVFWVVQNLEYTGTDAKQQRQNSCVSATLGIREVQWAMWVQEWRVINSSEISFKGKRMFELGLKG